MICGSVGLTMPLAWVALATLPAAAGVLPETQVPGTVDTRAANGVHVSVATSGAYVPIGLHLGVSALADVPLGDVVRLSVGPSLEVTPNLLAAGLRVRGCHRVGVCVYSDVFGVGYFSNHGGPVAMSDPREATLRQRQFMYETNQSLGTGGPAVSIGLSGDFERPVGGLNLRIRGEFSQLWLRLPAPDGPRPLIFEPGRGMVVTPRSRSGAATVAATLDFRGVVGVGGVVRWLRVETLATNRVLVGPALTARAPTVDVIAALGFYVVDPVFPAGTPFVTISGAFTRSVEYGQRDSAM